MKPEEMKETGEMTPEEQKETAETKINSEDNGSDAEEDIKSETQTVKKRKPKARQLVSVMLIIVGLLLIVVPIVLTQLNTSRNEDIIDQFLRDAEMAMADYEDISPEEEIVLPVLSEDPQPAETPSTEPGGDQEAVPSETPGGDSQADTSGGGDAASPASTKKPLMSKEEIQRRMTGVLIIEKINLRMIIMDGVDEETLRVAAGRMPGTGNFDEFGNVVLAGHRNYTFGKYFNRLDELEPGDKIIVQTKDKKLEYEVYKKHIIEPTDLSILEQSKDEKILTLFTCHPVAIATHRLVVHAKQIN
ncbi:MAG: class D sortase [Clostridiaceae bacterium]|nr:class D sortase [Clostridiaceae bacterium]